MPQLNSQDLQILYNAKQKKFKYAFVDEYYEEELLLRYGDDGIKEFEDRVEHMVLDPGNAEEYFDEDDWECVYSGDRESPPEYDLKENAEACPVIQVLRDTNECMLLEFYEYYLYLFNTHEQLQVILDEYKLTINDIINDDEIDVYPESLVVELIGASDFNISADEIRGLFT